MAYRFNIKERVMTPWGPGTVDVLPYSEEVNNYIVWMDKRIEGLPSNSVVLHDSQLSKIA